MGKNESLLMNELFCQNLRRIRKAHSLTQKQLGNAIGTSQATYNKYETGVTSPTLRIIGRLVNVLGIPVEEFFKDYS